MRFVVGSAEEAVTVIKQEMGETARVISVKQVAGNGLARFLSSPRLEVIAWIPPEDADVEDAEEPPQRIPPTKAAEPPPTPLRAMEESVSFPDVEGGTEGTIPPEPAYRQKVVSSSPRPAARGPSAEGRFERILGHAGFDPVLLESILGPGSSAHLSDKPIEHAITRLREAILTGERAQLPALSAHRIAFLGTPGCGKTTALCKWLTREVFIHDRPASVLRIDVDSPHFGDGLEAFCEALGVDCQRTPEELAEPENLNTRMLVDIPGCQIHDYRDNIALRRRLDELNVDARVLVLNAAYEASILKTILRQARDLEPTHLVFSHVDLLHGWGKLWPFALQSCHPPVLFLGTGPNIASDYVENAIAHLVQKTLP